MNSCSDVQKICANAKAASRQFAAQNTKKKNEILIRISNALIEKTDAIITANKLDLDSAAANGVPPHMLDRLMLNHKRIHDISDSLLCLTGLKDPVGS